MLSNNPDQYRNAQLVLWALVLLIYIPFFSYNDIWTPNESFYAEAVREMFESGNFLDINYNYTPRFNKPPLTYWLIAFSSGIFGLSEFAIRLPVLLLSIGTVWLVYLLGKLHFDRKTGILAAAVMAVSLQFAINKAYASPENPLAFFFTLTFYFYSLFYLRNRRRYLYLFYLALGLTVLTKGFPYYAVIGAIVFFHLLTKSGYRFKPLLKGIGELRLHWGFLIAIPVGMAWIVAMYLKHGSEFLEILNHETFNRAFDRNESRSLAELIYYPMVITWGFLPYSIVFFYAFIHNLVKWRSSQSLHLFMIWVLVMLVIFTVAEGKIPTYFIQAHPALAIIAARGILTIRPQNTWLNVLWKFSFWSAIIFIIGMTSYLIRMFQFGPATWLFLVAPVVVSILLYILPEETLQRTVGIKRSNVLPVTPFIFGFFVFAFLNFKILPEVETYRFYDQIGKAAKESGVPSDLPIYIERRTVHNLPFYAERRILRDQEVAEINGKSKETDVLALVASTSLQFFSDYETLWHGPVYRRGSESRFFILMRNQAKTIRGDFSEFPEYHLIKLHKKKPSVSEGL